MSDKNKYIDYKNSHSGKRHVKKGILHFAAVLVIAAVAVGVFAAFYHGGKIPGASNSAHSSAAAAAKVKNAVSSKAPVRSSSSDSEVTDGKTTTRIPVLMYHSVNFDPKNPTNILRVPRAKFAAEMKWLHDNGYKTLSLDELYNAVENKKPVPQKSVVLTFDDGYEDNYQNAFPFIKQYHFKATVFMITSRIGDTKNGYLTADEIKEMDKNGFSVECHTVNHLELSSLSYKRQYTELSDSKAALEKLLGHSIDYIAYPSGKYNADTIAAAKKIGYKLCFKMNGGISSFNDSFYEFPRTFVGENLNEFETRVEGAFKYDPA